MATINVGPIHHMRSDDAIAQITACYGHHEVTDACAVTIASWWQAPTGHGVPFAQLAGSGTVDSEHLADAIAATYAEATRDDDKLALSMLGTWALAKVQQDNPNLPAGGGHQ